MVSFKHFWTAAVIAAFSLTLAHAQAPQSAAAEKLRAPHHAGRVIVRFKADANEASKAAAHARAATKLHKRLSRAADVELHELNRGQDLAAVIAAYEASGAVEYAEPDYVVRASATPNDALYTGGYLWQHSNTGQSGGLADADMDSAEAWDARSAATGVIAVIDSGVRTTHEDLQANMWRNTREIAGNGIDDDGNGYADDVHGINIFTRNGAVMDDNGHGTHVAGTIGAVGNNGLGVTGVAWSVKLMALKALDAGGAGYTSGTIEAIEYARQHGATVINMSWGGPGYSQALHDAIARCRAAGVIMVAAAGNAATNNDTTPMYPASYALDNIVSVAATTRFDGLASFSNFGRTSVHLGAPGAEIVSTHHASDTSYALMSGTSMATPQVAGAIALVRSHFAGESHVQTISRVLQSVDPLPALTNVTRTGGRMNLFKALGLASTPAAPVAPVAPAAPTSLSATATSSTAVALKWTDGATNETGFEVERSTGTNAFARIATVATDATGYTDATAAAGTTYSYRVRAVRDGAASHYSNVASTQTPAAPAASSTWTSSDVGAVAAAGRATENNGVFTLNGSGADIWEAADEFHFHHRVLQGDGEIVARVTALQNTDAWAKVGVMIRGSLDARAQNAFVYVNPSFVTGWQQRSAIGGSTVGGDRFYGWAPAWLKLVRKGDVFTAFRSNDGTTWVQLGSATIAMPATAYMGLAVTSHRDGTLTSATVDRVSATGGAATAPAPAPEPSPTAPSALTGEVSSAGVVLRWTDNASNETGYDVERAVGSAAFSKVAAVAQNAATYTDGAVSSGTTYSYRVRAVNNSGASAYSNVATVATPSAPVAQPAPTAPAPAPTSPEPATGFQSRDIGAVAAAGRTAVNNGTYTVTGSGADIWGAVDEFHFHAQALTGDGEIAVRVSAVDNADGWTKAGVMMRATLDANAANAFVYANPSFVLGTQYRTAAGGTTVAGTKYYGWPPAWLKLVRSGNVFTAYRSHDGVAWTNAGSMTISMPATIYVGLAVTSHKDGALANATFDRLTLGGSSAAPAPAPSAPAAPASLSASATSSSSTTLTWQDLANNETGFEVERSADGVTFTRVRTTSANVTSTTDSGLAAGTRYSYRVRAYSDGGFSAYSNVASITTPAAAEPAPTTEPWKQADIGAVGVRGSATVTSATALTIAGGGGDIWGTADGFYYAWKTLRGDGQIVARVDSVENTDAWAKAGVMIRETSAANARHAFVYLTPTNGAGWHARTATGGSTANVAGSWWASAPHWVRLVRTGDTLKGYTSSDGVTWTLTSTQTIAMSADVCIGLAVTSHNATRTSTVRFSEVAISSP